MALAEIHEPEVTTAQRLINISPLPYGPLHEVGQVSSGSDFYKPTMSQFSYENERDAEVTFKFKNRGGQILKDHIDPKYLQARLDGIAERGFSADELAYLEGIQNSSGESVFTADYLDYIANSKLPPVNIEVSDDIEISTTGPWPLVTFWETVVMSEVNEAYFEGYVRDHGIDLMQLYEEGDRRLSEKIAYLQANPDIKIAEFGTRRRFSLRWQKHVIERLKNECPANLIGTSNVALAQSEELKPIGTFAHELPMVYAGLADILGKDIRTSHGQMLDDWFELYGDDYSIALSDTFGSTSFFKDFTPEQAAIWLGTRHDSGDPFEYGEKVIDFYEEKDIDPTTKKVVFSDGLNITKVEAIHRRFKGRLGHLFGIGTDLTNDLGVPALNIVMKATEVNGVETVKLSDNPGKHTGSSKQIRRYQDVFRA
jgi:nicotinate phosphoribosyltransferase